jgi:hypothetical protein
MPTPSPTEPLTPQQKERLLEQGIDQLMTTATGIVRMADAGTTVLPRICVAAAIRAVERLANHPDEMQRAISIHVAEDTAAALRDGLKAVEGLLTLLEQADPEGLPQ